MRKIKASGDYFTSHFADIPLLVFVFAIDDHGGANIYPAIWSALLAACRRDRVRHHHRAALR